MSSAISIRSNIGCPSSRSIRDLPAQRRYQNAQSSAAGETGAWLQTQFSAIRARFRLITGISLSALQSQDVRHFLFRDLPSSLDAEQIEDLVRHPIESRFSLLLDSDFQATVDAAVQFISVPESDEVLAATLLRLFARGLHRRETEACIQLAETGLRSRHLQVREAAIRLIESQPSFEALRLLTAHKDKDGWVQSYADAVIDDFQEVLGPHLGIHRA